MQRDCLIAELSGLQSSDEAASWAQHGLRTKHTLTAADAKSVEAAFRIKLANLDDSQILELPESVQTLTAANVAQPTVDNVEHPARSREAGIRRGRIAPKTIRLRDKEHRRFVSSQPCLMCGRSPADAHHLRFAQPRALGRKVSDEFTVPLCRVHHRELHRHGAEAAWWQSMKIDPLPIAHRLWQRSRLKANESGPGSVTTRSDLAEDPRPDGACHRMTSLRQIEANRRNAAKSTGPVTEAGKHRSRQNAVRHGLSAETVIEIVEDIDDYRGFEAAVIADYDARTAVERELVLRLASLLWRLRRATAIETDLLRIQAEILRDRRQGGSPDRSNGRAVPVLRVTSLDETRWNEKDDEPWRLDHLACDDASGSPPRPINPARQLSLCFQRINNLDNGAFERLGRYESAIARQVLRTLYLLRSARVR